MESVAESIWWMWLAARIAHIQDAVQSLVISFLKYEKNAQHFFRLHNLQCCFGCINNVQQLPAFELELIGSEQCNA